MSKIGKRLIKIPDGVALEQKDGVVRIKGPKGELSLRLPAKVKVETADRDIRVSVARPEDRRQRALWGTFRSHLSNMVKGVTEGFEKKLEIVGVGYKAQVTGDKLVLNVGYSHPIELAVPEGLQVKVEKNVITVTGHDKQMAGEFAARIRRTRLPEPYKGKGIKYQNEVIRRKAGKVVKAVGVG